MKYRLFKRKKSNQFFFQILSDNDVWVLESEGYEAKDGRNNGLRSVVENGGNPEMYEKRTSGDQFYFILKAKNGQEIARSAMYDSQGEADAAMAQCIAEIPGLGNDGDSTVSTESPEGKAVNEGANLVAANRPANIEIDAPPPAADTANQPKKKRKKRTGPKKEKIEKVYLSNGEYYFNDITYQVFRSGNGKHYFTFKGSNAKTLFMNASVRGFDTQEEAEEMVGTVMQHSPYEGNYEGKTTKNGKYYFYITDGAGKNLGKSFFYNTTDDMQVAIGTLLGNEAAIAAAQASGKGAANTPRRDDDYLACAAYEGAAGWHTFEKEGEYYFSYNDTSGKTLLRSEGYTTIAARDNGIASVKKNAPIDARWSSKEIAGKFFYALKAGNHQEIARSCPMDNERDANWIWAEVMNASAKSSTSDGTADDYLACEEYKGGEGGFHTFEKEGEFYFAFNDDAGNTILRSEGYTTSAARDNGIASVKKNAQLPERWRTVEEDGMFFRVLKAGNHQEIARSCPSADGSGTAWSWMWSSFSVTKAAAPTEPIPAPEPIVFEDASSGTLDDYLACEEYNGGEGGFHTFEKDGEYYFAFNDDTGNTILRSEGYTTSAARDNGIASVKKNAQLPERWSTVEEDGMFFRVLKAGNHQEIARSCPSADGSGTAWSWMWSSFSVTKAAAPSEPVPAPEPIVFEDASSGPLDDYLACEEYNGGEGGFHTFEEGEFYFAFNDDSGNTILRSEGYTTSAARDNGIASVKKNAQLPERWSTVEEDGMFFRVLKAGNHQEIARSCPSADGSGTAWSWMWSSFSVTKAAAPSEPIPAPEPIIFEESTADRPTDDYLPCEAYSGGPGFNTFEKGGEHYFSFNDDNGKTILRSEGYTTEKARDNGIASVKKNAPIDARWKTLEINGVFFRILKAGNGQEIGRSCPSNEAVGPAWSWLWGGFAVAGAVAPKGASAQPEPIVFEEKIVVEVKSTEDKEDDYLPCKEYEGHDINDKNNNVALFKHDNGQFYFAVYREDGSVRLRSEGFVDAKTRDIELSGVLKNLNDDDMYKNIAKGKYRMHILYDKTGREVGRSCLEKVEAGPVVDIATAAAAVALTAPVVIKTPEEKEDDYLPCKEYEGKTITDKDKNIALFKHENGQYYFAVYDSKGKVLVRSEGFISPENRKAELDGVIAYFGNPDMMRTIEKGKYRMNVFYDHEGREVGRSCLEKVEADTGAVAAVGSAAAAAAAAAAATSVAATPAVTVKADKEDDYLACKEYEGRKINDKQNKVALFKHDNAQFYFAVYRPDGSVRLRSEGFRTGKQRDVELSGVLKNIDNEDMYKTIQRGKYTMHILYDKTGREVGRSCLETEKVPIIPIAVGGAGVAAAAAAAAATTAAAATVTAATGKKEKPKAAAVGATGGAAGAGATGAGAAGGVKASGGGGGSSSGRGGWGWWPWLLLLPLILFALCYFTDCCKGCGAGIGDNDNKIELPKLNIPGLDANIMKGLSLAGLSMADLKDLSLDDIKAKLTAAGVDFSGWDWAWLANLKFPGLSSEVQLGLMNAGLSLGDFNGKTMEEIKAMLANAGVDYSGWNWDWFNSIPGVILEAPLTCNCSGNSDNSIFAPQSRTPRVVTKLGTNPEFGDVHNLDAAGFLARLNDSDSGRDKRFLDKMAKGMGYSGLPDLTEGMITSVTIPNGTTGNMGSGGKHRTVRTTLNVDSDRDLEAFRIKAANGCDLHFMKSCGNHFFFCPN